MTTARHSDSPTVGHRLALLSAFVTLAGALILAGSLAFAGSMLDTETVTQSDSFGEEETSSALGDALLTDDDPDDENQDNVNEEGTNDGEADDEDDPDTWPLWVLSIFVFATLGPALLVYRLWLIRRDRQPD